MKYEFDSKNHNGRFEEEGVYFDKEKNTFTFDFESDKDGDTILLTNIAITKTYIKDNVFVYGYQLLDDGINRSKFVGWLKNEIHKNGVSEDIQRFIDTVIAQFDKEERLRNYKCIIYPDSANNELIKTFLQTFNSYLTGNGRAVTSYGMIKGLFEYVEFDFDTFDNDCKINNVSQEELEKYYDEINTMLDKFKSDDIYKEKDFTFHGNVSAKFRPYFYDYLYIADDECNKIISNIEDSESVLIIDDTYISGATANEMIRRIQDINPNCNIIIFTLMKGVDDGDFTPDIWSNNKK